MKQTFVGPAAYSEGGCLRGGFGIYSERLFFTFQLGCHLANVFENAIPVLFEHTR